MCKILYLNDVILRRGLIQKFLKMIVIILVAHITDQQQFDMRILLNDLFHCTDHASLALGVIERCHKSHGNIIFLNAQGLAGNVLRQLMDGQFLKADAVVYGMDILTYAVGSCVKIILHRFGNGHHIVSQLHSLGSFFNFVIAEPDIGVVNRINGVYAHIPHFFQSKNIVMVMQIGNIVSSEQGNQLFLTVVEHQQFALINLLCHAAENILLAQQVSLEACLLVALVQVQHNLLQAATVKSCNHQANSRLVIFGNSLASLTVLSQNPNTLNIGVIQLIQNLVVFCGHLCSLFLAREFTVNTFLIRNILHAQFHKVANLRGLQNRNNAILNVFNDLRGASDIVDHIRISQYEAIITRCIFVCQFFGRSGVNQNVFAFTSIPAGIELIRIGNKNLVVIFALSLIHDALHQGNVLPFLSTACIDNQRLLIVITLLKINLLMTGLNVDVENRHYNKNRIASAVLLHQVALHGIVHNHNHIRMMVEETFHLITDLLAQLTAVHKVLFRNRAMDVPNGSDFGVIQKLAHFCIDAVRHKAVDGMHIHQSAQFNQGEHNASLIRILRIVGEEVMLLVDLGCDNPVILLAVFQEIDAHISVENFFVHTLDSLDISVSFIFLGENWCMNCNLILSLAQNPHNFCNHGILFFQLGIFTHEKIRVLQGNLNLVITL